MGEWMCVSALFFSTWNSHDWLYWGVVSFFKSILYSKTQWNDGCLWPSVHATLGSEPQQLCPQVHCDITLEALGRTLCHNGPGWYPAGARSWLPLCAKCLAREGTSCVVTNLEMGNLASCCGGMSMGAQGMLSLLTGEATLVSMFARHMHSFRYSCLVEL